MEFKDRLKLLRKERKLTQEALGRAIHISRSAIAKWEAGLGIPNEESVEALCEFFDIHREELFPDLRLEELLIEKNVKISRHKRGNAILLAIVFMLISFFSIWQTFYWLDYMEKEKKNNLLRIYQPRVTSFNLPSQSFVLGPYAGREYRYVIQRGQFVELNFSVEMDKAFGDCWIEMEVAFENLITTSTKEIRRRKTQDSCIIEYSTFIRVDSDAVEEIKFYKAIFIHVVEGIQYEKECLIEPHGQSIQVKEIWIKNPEIYDEI